MFRVSNNKLSFLYTAVLHNRSNGVCYDPTIFFSSSYNAGQFVFICHSHITKLDWDIQNPDAISQVDIHSFQNILTNCKAS